MKLRQVGFAATFGLAALISGTALSPANAQTCGDPNGNPEGPGFNPENVCAAYPKQEGPIINPAMQNPDMVAWRLMSEVNRPFGTTGMPAWRSWPEQGQVFPVNPDPNNPPKVADLISEEHPFIGRPALQQVVHKGGKDALAAHQNPCQVNNVEEVKMAPATVSYIYDNDLWYQEGIAKQFAANFTVNLPSDAFEVKANWAKQEEAPGGDYFTITDPSGQVWVLIAFHINSKIIPNWHWSTFEHVNNPCRGKYLEAQDTFGFPDNSSEPSKELLQMWDTFGLNPNIWSNYRLDGAQVDFNDPEGRPIILGNSITELGFQTTASCITCHQRASANSEGKSALSVFNPKDVYNSQPQSFHGTPDPNWFYSSFDPLTRKAMPLDFMWSLAFCPNAIGSTTAACPVPAFDK